MTKYQVGDRVTVKKYGSEYAATVVEVGRSRVKVRFTPKNGNTKEQWISGSDVPYVVRMSY